MQLAAAWHGKATARRRSRRRSTSMPLTRLNLFPVQLVHLRHFISSCPEKAIPQPRSDGSSLSRFSPQPALLAHLSSFSHTLLSARGLRLCHSSMSRLPLQCQTEVRLMFSEHLQPCCFLASCRRVEELGRSNSADERVSRCQFFVQVATCMYSHGTAAARWPRSLTKSGTLATKKHVFRRCAQITNEPRT